MTTVIDRSLGQQWLVASVLMTFAAASLLMAAVGVYGVASYGVRQRAREFSIRMALSADRRDVVLMVLARGAALTALGLGLGVAGSLVATRGLNPLLHGVSRVDPASLAAAAAVLALATLIATILPARRAVKLEPMAALRAD